MSCSKTSEWFFQFCVCVWGGEGGEESIGWWWPAPRLTSVQFYNRITERVYHIICTDHHQSTDEVSVLAGISHGSCHRGSDDAVHHIKVCAQTSECWSKTAATWCLLWHQSLCPHLWVLIKSSNNLMFALTSKCMLPMTPTFFQMSLQVIKPGSMPTI